MSDELYRSRIRVILDIVLPIYLIIVVGYAAVRSGFIEAVTIKAFGRFVITFCLPCTIFHALTQLPISEVVNQTYLLVYGIGSLLTFGAAYLGARLRSQSSSHAALCGLGSAMPNSAFIGISIVSGVLGSQAIAGLAMCMMIENMLILPLCIVLATGSNVHHSPLQAFGAALAQTFKNPLVIAISAGMGVAVLGVSLPTPIDKALTMMAGISSPLALFVVGGVLAQVKLQSHWGHSLWLSFGKLVLHPTVVLLTLWLMPGEDLDHDLFLALILFSSMPMAAFFPVLALRYGEEQMAASALFISTLLSLLSISLVLYFIPK